MFNGLATDEKLITKALSGSQSSWVGLVRRHEKMVYNYCLRMTGSSGDAMDLMQEVFLATYRNLPSYRGSGCFSAWVMKIAVNKTIDFRRSVDRNPQDHGEEFDDGRLFDSLPGSHAGPDSHYEDTVLANRIRGMLDNLPAEQRLIIELKFFQHFTFEDISQQTGVSINTVKTRLYSALRKLKDDAEQQHVM